MTKGKNKTVLIIAAIIAALIVTVLPPLLLGIGLLWFLCPVVGILLFIGIFMINRSLIMTSGALFLVALVVGLIGQPSRLTPEEKQKLDMAGYFMQGEVHHLRLEYPEALAAYKNSERLGLNHPWVTFQRSRIQSFVNQQDEAFDAIFFLMQNPYGNLPMNVLYPDYAVTALRAGEDELGVRLFEESILMNFSPAAGYSQLGTFYRMRGKPKKAQEAISAAYKLGFEQSECSRRLAEIASIQGDFVKAEELFKRSIHENMENTSTYNSYGEMLARLKRYAEAEDILKKGKTIAETAYLKYNPVVHTEILTNLAYVLAEQGRQADALIVFQELVQEIPLNPLFVLALENWADLYLKMNQPQKAYYKFQDALRAAQMTGDSTGFYRIQRRMQMFSAPGSG